MTGNALGLRTQRDHEFGTRSDAMEIYLHAKSQSCQSGKKNKNAFFRDLLPAFFFSRSTWNLLDLIQDLQRYAFDIKTLPVCRNRILTLPIVQKITKGFQLILFVTLPNFNFMVCNFYFLGLNRICYIISCWVKFNILDFLWLRYFFY